VPSARPRASGSARRIDGKTPSQVVADRPSRLAAAPVSEGYRFILGAAPCGAGELPATAVHCARYAVGCIAVAGAVGRSIIALRLAVIPMVTPCSLGPR